MKKILITGGSGFIGTNLVQHFKETGWDVLNVDIRPPRNRDHEAYWKKCDILDKSGTAEFFESFQPECVVHLAARTDLEEKEDIEKYSANTEGVRNVIDAICRCGTVRSCIYASSQLVCRVGHIPEHDEDYCPNTLYGESKVRGERIVKENHGGVVSWCLVRPTTVWGPWGNSHHLRFYRMIRRGRYFHVGKEDRYKSYGYVGNFCRQVAALLGAPAGDVTGRTFYLADYEPLSIRQWADRFQHEMGAPRIRTIPLFLSKGLASLGDLCETAGYGNFPLTSFRLNNILTEYVFDLSAILRLVPDLPFTMEEGVGHTVAWLRIQGGS